MASGVQSLRLRRPLDGLEPQNAKRTSTLPKTSSKFLTIQRSERKLWSPSFSSAVRMLLLVRVSAAMYSNIQDCDEVFNFWEPLHFADRGYGFQTWEVSPRFAIRSWAYVLLHLIPAKLTAFIIGPEKRPVFFAIRITLGVISTLCEAALCRAVADTVNVRVGRYLLFMLMTSAGMWNAAPALLPSSLAMYAITMAFAYSLEVPNLLNNKRTRYATLLFASGAIIGWPFCLALAIPFVFEELFIRGADTVIVQSSWMFSRCMRLFAAGATASILFVPVFGMDSLIYGKPTLVPWNIIQYNIFGGSARGPDLYGTSPWNFYFLNLTLNFNILLPLALFAMPALAINHRIDRRHVGLGKFSPGQSSPYTLLAIRLAPVYVWIGILSMQAHKEERFMFPAYPLLCFNAAVTLYLMRGWMETAFVSVTKSSYKASKTSIFRTFTLSVTVASSLVSLSRIMALFKYYHAPMTTFFAFETLELPHLLNETGLLPPAPPDTPQRYHPRIDLAPIEPFDLHLCLGKEWYRFPGHYLVPTGITVDFVRSNFDGLLPGHFQVISNRTLGWRSLAHVMSVQPEGLNDLNQEEPSHYVPLSACDYLVDVDYPLHPVSSPLEPRYSLDDMWERVFCTPFLDARHSSLLTRALWIPGERWQRRNEFGDYCLLRNRETVRRKVDLVKELTSAPGL